MKTCFIFANKRCELFDLSQDVYQKKIKFIWVIKEKDEKNIPKETQKFLEKKYTIELGEYVEYYNIVKNEINSITDINDVRIVCTDENSLLIAAKLREELGIKGAKIEDINKFRDKDLMKKELQAKGIRVPKYIKLNSSIQIASIEKEFYNAVEYLGIPFIIKPIDGASSVSTELIKDLNQFVKFFKKIKRGEYLLEEFISGRMFHCDTFFYNGKVQFSAVSEYTWPNLDHCKGKTLGSLLVSKTDKNHDRFIEYNKKVLEAYQAINGAYHLEFILKGDEIVFIEIGARPVGALTSNLLLKNFSINLYDLTLRNELELELNIKIQKDLYHSWYWLPRYPGKIKNIILPNLQSEVIYKEINVSEGEEIIEYPKSIVDAASIVLILKNHDYNKMQEDFNTLKYCKPLIMG